MGMITRTPPPSVHALSSRRYDEGMDEEHPLFTTAEGTQHPLFTTAEAAAQLGIAHDTVRGAIRAGTLAVVRVNPRLNMVTADAIAAYRRDHLGRVGRPSRKKRRPRLARAAPGDAVPAAGPAHAADVHHPLDKGGAIHPPEETTDGHDA